MKQKNQKVFLMILGPVLIGISVVAFFVTLATSRFLDFSSPQSMVESSIAPIIVLYVAGALFIAGLIITFFGFKKEKDENIVLNKIPELDEKGNIINSNKEDEAVSDDPLDPKNLFD